MTLEGSTVYCIVYDSAYPYTYIYLYINRYIILTSFDLLSFPNYLSDRFKQKFFKTEKKCVEIRNNKSSDLYTIYAIYTKIPNTPYITCTRCILCTIYFNVKL